MRTALIAGSTGLIGNHLLQLLLDSPEYDQVIALSRKALPAHSKLTVIRTEYENLLQQKHKLKTDDVFCCLGTTMATAGSKEKFYEVDFSYPLEIGRMLLVSGAKQFMLVSAVGANAKSSIYYNKVKGEIEGAITTLGYETVHIFRPSLLLGNRGSKRPGEDAAKWVYKTFGFLFPEKYKAVESSRVAQAMLDFALQNIPGVHIHESNEIRKGQA